MRNMDSRQAKTYLSVQRRRMLQDKLEELEELFGNKKLAEGMYVRLLGMTQRELADLHRDLSLLLGGAGVLPEPGPDRREQASAVHAMVYGYGEHPAYLNLEHPAAAKTATRA